MSAESFYETKGILHQAERNALKISGLQTGHNIKIRMRHTSHKI